ncbi:Helix-turn-helix domain-containing protein [Nitrosomonas ureae]|uniref:Helix-turn-helix domain-containing protein n=2 Tax=Nitrosomonas ureae TaxID=44577 RepID=A0A1H9A0A0_9PROT|nr:Helix-turn-helix domain-containing protein [Nitrosomonas ureae]
MKHYKQLTREQRYQISGLKKAGLNQSQIADEVGVHKSTISREFERNKGRRGWRPRQAQELRDERPKQCVNVQRHSLLEWTEVERLIWLDMSPEQASCRLVLECGLRISHETIYVYIYEDKRRGGDLWQHLRCQKPHRKRYAGGQERRGTIKNRIGINERPGIVDQKSHIGDWEGGTVIDKEPSRRIGHIG